MPENFFTTQVDHFETKLTMSRLRRVLGLPKADSFSGKRVFDDVSSYEEIYANILAMGYLDVLERVSNFKRQYLPQLCTMESNKKFPRRETTEKGPTNTMMYLKMSKVNFLVCMTIPVSIIAYEDHGAECVVRYLREKALMVQPTPEGPTHSATLDSGEREDIGYRTGQDQGQGVLDLGGVLKGRSPVRGTGGNPILILRQMQLLMIEDDEDIDLDDDSTNDNKGDDAVDDDRSHDPLVLLIPPYIGLVPSPSPNTESTTATTSDPKPHPEAAKR
ncbi:hypothetical protein L6452_01736 [Arctium lappa]|uniref:Uncharacterized protein n=1 Tax=Arctium lappa TaxID=4217 RepID=A0ACB9FID1_ARCLA|nr:hypothetical protein L6452_01736 [Arctium lappa]